MFCVSATVKPIVDELVESKKLPNPTKETLAKVLQMVHLLL